MHQSLSIVSGRPRYAKPLFLATIVTGSFLLFLTQPMIARMALPRIGGAPAVWNSAMLVYQALLLGGYAYAHWLGRLAPRKQAGLHLAVFAVAALWLPIGLSAAVPPADAAPAVWVPWFLLSSIGPLFLIVSAQAPLMQRWYALEDSRGDPYPLYAASNLGSFAGLISYPLIVEPLLTLEQQSLLWTCGYALLVLLVVGCALTIPARAVEAVTVKVSSAPSRKAVALWIALAGIPSGLMLSTTTHLTTDIVAMPLLWAIPLGLYLLSFVVAFAERRRPADVITRIAPVVLLIAGGIAFVSSTGWPILAATLGLSLLFVVSVTLHAELYRLRPAADRLTGFYLAMSVGGVLGGAVCALLAPSLFDWAYEHPLLVFAAALLLPQRNYFPAIERIWSDRTRAGRLGRFIPIIALLLSLAGDRGFSNWSPEWAGLVAPIAIGLLALFSLGRHWVFAACLAALMMSLGGWSTVRLSWDGLRTRSYFGIYTVGDRDRARILTHGTTVHGVQSRVRGFEREPTSYYVHGSGIGMALDAAEMMYGPNAAIGVIGLGTGTLACYAAPGQSWTFFEIDPVMVAIAKDVRKFSFMRRCAPDARVVVGDARLKVADELAASYDILAVDAFSSDSVPMHLLTGEALDVYGRALRPHGLLLFHITNRYLNLEPVIAADARRGGWSAALVHFVPDETNRTENAGSSVWVAMSRDPATLAKLTGRSPKQWRDLEERPGFAGWTDNYASILPLLKGLTAR